MISLPLSSNSFDRAMIQCTMWLELNFLSLDQNVTEIYRNNSNCFFVSLQVFSCIYDFAGKRTACCFFIRILIFHFNAIKSNLLLSRGRSSGYEGCFSSGWVFGSHVGCELSLNMFTNWSRVRGDLLQVCLLYTAVFSGVKQRCVTFLVSSSNVAWRH